MPITFVDSRRIDKVTVGIGCTGWYPLIKIGPDPLQGQSRCIDALMEFYQHSVVSRAKAEPNSTIKIVPVHLGLTGARAKTQ